MTRPGAILLAASALLSACGREAPVASARAAPAPAASTPLEAAFRTAFGEPSPAMRVIDRQAGAGEGGDVTLRYRPLQLLDLGERVALVSGGQTEGCGACVGSLSIHYLRKTAGGYQRLGAWPEIAEGARFGAPPQVRLQTGLFAGPTLEVLTGGAWRGCALDRADFIELTEGGPVVRARGVLIDWNGEGRGEGAAVQGRPEPGRPGESFHMRYSGDVDLVVDYRRHGEIYQPEGPQPDLPEC